MIISERFSDRYISCMMYVKCLVLYYLSLDCLWLQCAKEYYEQALMQELKKNQELQEYIRLLENRVYNPGKECRLNKQVYTSHLSAHQSSY